MKYFSIIACIFGLYLFACADTTENDCTDDGCPEFVSMIQELDAEFASYEVIPTITTETKDDFVYSLNSCITHLYKDVPLDQQIPRELIIAQAAIETGWGKSRFANEGNNLFGIRTFNKDSEWLLPITWDQDKWIGWGVKVYQSKCQSVKDYVRIINTVFAYEKFRELRSQNANVYDLVDTLDKYATKNSYTELVKKVIKYNIEGVYEL